VGGGDEGAGGSGDGGGGVGGCGVGGGGLEGGGVGVGGGLGAGGAGGGVEDEGATGAGQTLALDGVEHTLAPTKALPCNCRLALSACRERATMYPSTKPASCSTTTCANGAMTEGPHWVPMK